MGVELKEPIVSEKAIKYNYTNEMGVGSCVRFLKNIMGLVAGAGMPTVLAEAGERSWL